MTTLSKIWDYLKSPGPMAVIALLGIGFGYYQTFVYEKRGELVVQVKSLSRVFDVHQTVGGLQISYAGEDLRVSKKALWVMTLAISNIGNAEIRKGDYDEQVPVGFETIGANLVDVPTVTAANDYLTQNAKLKVDKSRVLLSPVILEPEDSVSINVLLLGPESTKPTIKALGKVAGVKDIHVQNSEDTAERKSFLEQMFDTRVLWVYPIRFFFYFLIMLLGIMAFVGSLSAVIAPFEKLADIRARSKRRDQIAPFLGGNNLTKETRRIANLYVKHGERLFPELKKVLRQLDTSVVSRK